MKNKVLYTVIGLMSAAVISLTAVQVYWIRKAVEVRDNHFKSSVHEALRAVANRLQMIETASILIEATAKAEEIEAQSRLNTTNPPNTTAPKPDNLKDSVPPVLSDYELSKRNQAIVPHRPYNGKLIDSRKQSNNGNLGIKQSVYITTLYDPIRASKQCSIMARVNPSDATFKISVEKCNRHAKELHDVLRKLVYKSKIDTNEVQNPIFTEYLRENFGYSLAQSVSNRNPNLTNQELGLLAGLSRSWSEPLQQVSDSLDQCISPALVHRIKLEQKSNLIQQLIKELTVANKPIAQRINLNTLDTLMREEMNNFGIHRQFSYGILGKDSLTSSQSLTQSQASDSPYKVKLFSYDLNNNPYYLVLRFVDDEPSIWAANSWVLSLAAVSLSIILLSFGYTVITIHNQKKLGQMKNDFINNMTHEFKTPITTISLLSELLSKTTESTKTDKIHKYANIIYDENKRLEHQVERVLQIAEIDRKEIRLNLSDIDVNEIVNSTIHKVSVQVEQRGGKIITELSADNPKITADSLHFANIIFNLIDNANKYSPESPEITIKTAKHDNGITVSVQDKGLGMTPEQQRHIFQKFYRVPTGNRHDVKGFGLGLSYVKSLVESHGGAIKVKSELGVGSLFEVFFPNQPKSL